MLIFPLKKQLRSAQNALNLSEALTGSTGAKRCLMSHECHESEYSKFLKSLGIDKEKMLTDMESRLSEDERNRLRKMRLERIAELEKENAELKDYRLITLKKQQTEIQKYALNLEHKLSLYDDKLTKAKKIIGNLYAICKDNHYPNCSVLMEQAEQFLQED